jgi:hypothetical protein
MAGLVDDAKRAVDSVTKSENPEDSQKSIIIPISSNKEATQTIPKGNEVTRDQDHIRVGSGQYQEHNTEGPDKEQVRSRSGSDKEQVKISPKDHHESTKSNRAKQITKGSPSTSLSKSQTMVFLWFKQRGQSGVFNKPEIGRALSMPYITIRKAITKLETVGAISLKYDSCQKIYEYYINQEKALKLSKNINIGSGSYQDRHNIISTPLISSSSILNKTTTMQNCESNVEKIIAEIMATDPEYTYWIDQQVSPKQVSIWKYEFGLDLQTILNNLCYVRWQIVYQKAEINKGAAQYIYGIMKKNGGTVNKPAGYKTMAQMDLAFFEDWKKQRNDHAQKIERIKTEAIRAEIDPKISAILEKPNFDNKHLQIALERIHSEKRKQEIISMIKNEKPLDENSKAALRGYLERILIEESFEDLTL